MHQLILGQISSPDAARLRGWLIIGVLIAIALFIGYLNYRNAKPFRIEASTTLRPSHALDRLQAQFARDGWSLGYRDGTTLIMQTARGANLSTTAAIGCLSVWLGLLHLLMSRRSITLEVTASEMQYGSAIIANGSQCGGNVLTYTAYWLRELPKS